MNLATVALTMKRHTPETVVSLHVGPLTNLPARVLEGETAKFRCRVTGYPTPKVNWYLNGQLIRKSKRFRLRYDGIYYLEVTDIKSYDSGVVKVLAENPEGRAEHTVKLEIQQREDLRSVLRRAPEIKPPERMATPEHGKVSFEVIKAEKPTEFVQERDEYSLFIFKVDKECEGDYICTAINEFGGSTCTTILHVNAKDSSEPSTQQIQGHSPYFTKETKSAQVMCDGQIQFDYIVLGVPLPEIKWFKGRAQVLPGKRFTIVNSPDGSGFLKLMALQQQDSGLATCQMMFFKQKEPPRFDTPLKPVTVNEGEKLSLSCHVHGSPPLKVQWMKDRREVTSSASTKIIFVDGLATLENARVSKGDAGDYLCKATNDAGSEFCKAKVTVKGG
uniref:Ig-like domain-containing protein n=1 Tax=Denticeps clupeoides TaxID=299321 RepID=A0AAY4EWI1_9TELE